MATQPVDVYITIDTEVWPDSLPSGSSDLNRVYDEDVYGVTPSGEFGIRFQMDILDAFNLRAVFFLESLVASAVGPAHLTRMVETIQSRGHDVQLHVHPEWLRLGAQAILPNRTGQHMKDFDVEEQTRLIEVGLENLRRSGATNVCAFRAGNCGANLDTVRAVGRNDLAYDTSYNIFYHHSHCELKTDELLVQPTLIEGVTEIPITFFEDWPGHYRHVQLCACSTTEIQSALLSAYESGWRTFVVLSHSFELVTGRHSHPRRVRADHRVVRRFQELCRFIASHRDKFRTMTFGERPKYGRPPRRRRGDRTWHGRAGGTSSSCHASSGNRSLLKDREHERVS